jgi:hypothetical protein
LSSPAFSTVSSVARPPWIAHRGSERRPFLVAEAGDHAPAVLVALAEGCLDLDRLAAKGPVRRCVRQPIARPRLHTAVHGVVHHRRRQRRHRRLDLRQLDALAAPGLASMPQRRQDGHQRVAGVDDIIRVIRTEARGRSGREATEVVKPRDRPQHGAEAQEELPQGIEGQPASGVRCGAEEDRRQREQQVQRSTHRQQPDAVLPRGQGEGQGRERGGDEDERQQHVGYSSRSAVRREVSSEGFYYRFYSYLSLIHIVIVVY